MEVKNLREDLEARNYQVAVQTKEMDSRNEELERLKVKSVWNLKVKSSSFADAWIIIHLSQGDLVAVNTQPGQIAKEADKVSRQKK